MLGGEVYWRNIIIHNKMHNMMCCCYVFGVLEYSIIYSIANETGTHNHMHAVHIVAQNLPL